MLAAVASQTNVGVVAKKITLGARAKDPFCVPCRTTLPVSSALKRTMGSLSKIDVHPAVATLATSPMLITPPILVNVNLPSIRI